MSAVQPNSAREPAQSATVSDSELDAVVRARSLELIAVLAAKIAHEIKNPLAGIYGAANVLVHGLSNDDPRREVLEGIRREVLRLDEVVMELVDFARAPAVRARPTPLRNFVEDVVAPIRARLASGGVSIEVRIDEHLTAPLDPRLIAQVLRGLLLNASQALGGGPGWIRVESEAGPGHVELSVLDSGPGFAPEVLPRVFEPFYSTRSRGVGLGLTIGRQHVEAHGGVVQAENRAHGGACVRFTLPLVARAAAGAPPAA
jgi:signal transduction histidine kinase